MNTIALIVAIVFALGVIVGLVTSNMNRRPLIKSKPRDSKAAEFAAAFNAQRKDQGQ